LTNESWDSIGRDCYASVFALIGQRVAVGSQIGCDSRVRFAGFEGAFEAVDYTEALELKNTGARRVGGA
jgi:hypothetical protein